MKQTNVAVPAFRRALIASTTIALALALASPLFAQAGLAEREGRALRIGIIGSGTMGGAIGLLWAEAGHQILFSSRNPHELMDLVQSAAPRASAGYADAAAFFGDVILLAVLDSAIAEVAADLVLRPGTIVLHLSGSRGIEALDCLPEGAVPGCYHPLQSFAPQTDPALVVPPYCLAIEGPPAALSAARALAEATGHPAVTLRPGGKAAYHAAAVLASNCLVALEAAATRVMGLAGAPEEERWTLLWPLVVGTLANLKSGEFAAAITGPVPRGDAATVERNLAAIGDDEAAAELYRVLGRATLDLVRDRLEPERASAVEKLLRG
jgi:predicted short-subunit dehydrogenase-like oxidoreductase (DUF2520 family)